MSQEPLPATGQRNDDAVAVGSTGASEPTGAIGRAKWLLKRYKLPLQIALLLLIAVFLGSVFWKSGAQLQHYSWQVNWGLFGAGFALFAAQELSFALIWREILRRLGSTLDVLSSERIYLGAECVRYIPGNVWHVITRVLWAERKGVPKAVGFASMVIELATKIASAALVFVVTLFFWHDARALAGQVPQDALLSVAAIGLPLLLLGLHPRLLFAVLDRGLRLVKREPMRIALSYRAVLAVSGLWAASWVVAGCGFYLLTEAVVPSAVSLPATLLAIGIYAIGWDIGFLTFVTPSGLGFRELAIAFLLGASGLVPNAALAVVIALLARVLTTASELVCIGGAYLVRGKTLPAPQGEDASPARQVAH